MKPPFVSAAALLACAVLAILLFRARQDAAASKADLAALRAATNDLSAQLADLQSQIPTDADRSRMEAAQREAIRLRGEVASLKQTAVDAKAAAVATQSPIAAPALRTDDPFTNPYA